MRPHLGEGPLLLLGVLAVGCGRENSAPEDWSGPPDLDPILRERLESVREQCARGERGALLELAKTYEANGLHDLAAEAYQRCLAEPASIGDAPLAEVHFRRATSLDLSFHAPEALAAYRRAQELARDYAPAYWRAGNLLLEQGRADEARLAFERALELEPDGVPQTLGLARALLETGAFAEARRCLESLAARSPRERFVHGLLARACRALGVREGAEAALAAEQRAVEMRWSDPWTAEVATRATGVSAAIVRANELLLRGDAPGALRVLEPAHARVPDDLALALMLIKARIEAGDLERAQALVERVRATHGSHHRLELYSGLIALRRKDARSARSLLLSALALSPAYGPTHAALGEAELRQGELARAELAFERALELGENDLRTRVLHAQVEIQLGALERACGLLEELCTEFPGSAVPLGHLAEAQARRGDVASARTTLARAEALDPSFAHLARVRALLESPAPAGR